MLVRKMGNVKLFTLCCFLLLFLHEGTALRCRSGNGHADAQFQKVLKTCKNRYSDSNSNNSENFMSAENNDSASDSSDEKDVYNENFVNKEDDRFSYNRSSSNQKYRYSERTNDMNWNMIGQSRNGNMKDTYNVEENRRNNNRTLRNRKNDFNKGDINMHFNNNADLEQGCIVQCFFNELNAVDRSGFPERDLVISLMTQDIQDPDLKDFVQESIIECFLYLESNRKEMCEFSQNLLTCLAEKGKQKCDDWEN